MASWMYRKYQINPMADKAGKATSQMADVQTKAQLEVEVAELKEKLAEVSKPNRLALKVSEKGAISIYGLQRMPVTLYHAQWKRLLAHSDAILQFGEDNSAKLSYK